MAPRDLELTARLMEQGLRDVLNRLDRPTLERWLRLLPDEYIQRRPGLMMIKAWALEFSFQFDAQLKVLRQIETLMEEGAGALLSTDDLLTLRGQIVTLQGQEAYISNQPTLAIARCHEALALLPKSWSYVRGALTMFLGFSMQASGQGRAAERMLLDAYESLGNKSDGYALRLLMALGFNFYWAGNLEQTVQVARRMLQQTTPDGLAILRGWAHYFLALVHYQWNDLDTAREHAAQCLKLVQQMESPRTDLLRKVANINEVFFTKKKTIAIAMLRKLEIKISIAYIRNLIKRLGELEEPSLKPIPEKDLKLAPDSLCVCLVEGWRGEICHCAVTNSEGMITHYKVKDPSMHNWLALALSLRDLEISDFLINNKSYNLSYCGHDL
jgi:tetratricopeptide (TPR) repeat protein